MVILKKGEGTAYDLPGTWYVWIRHPGDRPLVDIMCPKCKKSFFIDEHGVRADGAVYPSIVCPHKCGFHSFGILEDWIGIELPEIL